MDMAVSLTHSGSVLAEIQAMLAPRFAAWPGDVVAAAFRHTADAYSGRVPGLLACDTPYHDLRHALATALAAARLVDGWEEEPGPGGSLGGERAAVTVILALMHDIGFLRRESEAHVNGATLTPQHEARAAALAAEWLAATPLVRHGPMAALIDATRLGCDFDALAGDCHGLLVARFLATADLVAQLADREYLEKCRDFLYAEFVEAGLARGADGRNAGAPYASPEDLLRKTPGFCRGHVLARLDRELGGVHRLFARHFGGEDAYAVSIARNLAYLEDAIAANDLARLKRMPRALLAEPH